MITFFSMGRIRRRLFSLVGLSAGLLASAHAFGQADGMRKFRSEVLEILRRRFPEVSASPGDDDGSIRIDPITVNLHNLYAAVRQLPPEKKEVAVIEFLQHMAETLSRTRAAEALSWVKARELVRPRLLPSSYIQAALPIVYRRFVADVILAYAIDYGSTVKFVDPKTFEEWGITIEVLHDVTISNLEALSTNVAIEVLNPPGATGRLVAVASGDTYDAARLALPGFRARLTQVLGDTAYVGIPNRDFLVAWSADFSRAANIVAQVEKDARQQPYPLTDTIFVVTRTGVRPASAAERRR
jgi:uncharacterized protein YtpQ (UPF0354 family)